MAKSVLLAKIARTLESTPDHFVAFINIGEWIAKLLKQSSTITEAMILESLRKLCNNCDASNYLDAN